ncbi:MAG: polysaccharide deacetylase family protein [Rhodospirillaceae bacterium]|jgi:peptidoglycan-N-acetylglucosamine deacetylase|nr:polysaccharide deacetylase family protein [Rhodospirillaceae bacterium]MBT5194299.1 polysaccharide deacetylase family protein [Rhodospirillaceae bacterium]MBT5895117.1 polysaccharide deacetylase family protein [Rhodospirillaceae bacterium]MBT6428638.1 polysaccharide deacetylase family protein [Rhodospirillaceae bacterium]MBT7760222.1 polysaccharide deacetylase family protein [Rhodospirillaceae bacterium]
MPWKENYTASDEVTLFDDEVRWPEGRRCCVVVNVDLSLASGAEGLNARDLRGDRALFGLHEGMAQLRAVLDRFDMKATFTVPAVMARMLGDTLRELALQGHEIAAHGFKHEDVSTLDRAEEKARMALTTEILTEVLGKRPQGWYSLPRQSDPFAVGTISPHTAELLIEAGYSYMGNSLSDDIPHYWVADFGNRQAILTMPYFYHFDDQFFLLFPSKGTGLEHADTLFANWRAEFDAQYKRGRHFHMTLHPHAVGWCNRIKLLEDFFNHIRSRPGVWNPTAGQCADYWLETYPASTHLRLEESIWQDYPGSLS